MNQAFLKKTLLILLLSCSNMSFSQTAGELVQAKLNAIRSMTAHFNQVVKAKKRELSRSSGTMALERPGRFRWETNDPMEQLVIADGQNMWIYDKDLEQVTVKKQAKGLGGTAALFLSSYDNNLTKDFEVTQKSSGNNSVFDLKSKSSKENFQKIQLTFNQAALTAITLYDQLGQVTSVQLVQVHSNLKLAPKLFQFKPPKGVDVIKQ